MKEKYVAYVGTYTHGSSIGIHIYDVNVEEGTLKERKVVPVNNSSHLARSLNGKYLYSIADEGVAVFAIEPDGDLTFINKVDIDGMRGCHLSTDEEGKYLFVAGYHDGKVTVVHTHKDGRLGSVVDGVFHKGLGSVGERNFRPHVSCVRPTPDNKYLCAVDNGIDQMKVYRRYLRRSRRSLLWLLMMIRSMTLRQECAFLLTDIIFSAPQQVKIQWPCIREMRRRVFWRPSLSFLSAEIIRKTWMYSRMENIWLW